MTTRRSCIWQTLLVGAGLLSALAGCGSHEAVDRQDGDKTEAAESPVPDATLAGQRADYIQRVQLSAGQAYRVSPDLRAANPSHRLVTDFHADAVRITPDGTDWYLGMTLSGYGCAGAPLPAVLPAEPEASNNRVDYARVTESGAELSEWYLNGPLGLEQGFTLPRDLGCAGETVIELEVEGDVLTAAGASAIHFRSPLGGSVVSYQDLHVRDAVGQQIPATMSVDDGRIALRVDARQAEYPLVVDPLLAVNEQKYTVLGGGAANDWFGAAVALDGDTALVGSTGYHASDYGAAYAYVRSGAVWTMQQRILPPTPAANDRAGLAVAIWQDTAAVGQAGPTVEVCPGMICWDCPTGRVRIHVRSGGVWSQQASFSGNLDNRIGGSVAVHQDTIAFGSPVSSHVVSMCASPTESQVHVHVRSGTTWSLQQTIGHPAFELFGEALDLEGDTLLIGAAEADSRVGAAYVFERTGTTWSQQQRLQASDGVANSDFGQAVSLSADRALVGAVGAAYVFERTGTIWVEEDKLTTSAAAPNFGEEVSLVGDRALVGAYSGEGAVAVSGAAYLFAREGTSWVEQHSFWASDGEAGDRFGDAAALSADAIVVGAPYDDERADNAGAVYMYEIKLSDGSPCTDPVECNSGNCVDGVCCDTACPGPCSACTAAFKGSGVDGECGLVAEDTDPRDACTDEGANSCGQDGFCDGIGMCRMYVAGSECMPGSCLTQTSVQNPHVCDGIGSCTNMGTSDCLPGYACVGGACQTSCLADTDCVADHYCNASACVPDEVDGVACTDDGHCQSGFCVDGVCCNSQCNSLCQACSATLKNRGVDGVCEFISDGFDSQDECGNMGAPPCDGDGVCNGFGSCRAVRSGEVCNPASCRNDLEVNFADVCDDAGVCIDAGSSGCGTYKCLAGACLTTCTTTNDCNPAYECLGGNCGTGAPLGDPCQNDTDCSSLQCVESVCCNTECSGACESCLSERKESGQDTGLCGAIRVDTDPKNACAPGAGECDADGYCDGAGSCRAYAPTTVSCQGGSTCATPTSYSGMHCDGSGSCVAGSSIPCTPYVCTDVTGTCLTACAISDDCAPGYYCENSQCLPQVSDGTSCSLAEQCLSDQCTEGVCCDAACTGNCESCLATLKAGGADGRCGPIAAGTDPKDACASGAGECDADGLCDGAGACRQFAPDTVPCQGGTTCSSSTEASGQACNGAGACVVTGGTSCVPYTCSSATGTCLQSCNLNTECATGYFCRNTVCVPEYLNGDTCTDAAECASGNCVEGVCCNSACTLECMSCVGNATGGLDGVCANVLPGTVDPKRLCQVSSNPCGGDGTCQAGGLCSVFRPSGTLCGATVCNGSALDRRICDGFGTCTTASTSCAPFDCDSNVNGCRGSCLVSVDCASGYYCEDTACVPAHNNGELCAAPEECASGYCVDGVCCDAACTAECMSCVALQTGSVDGMCRNVLAGNADPRGICPISPDPCGPDGSCDGAGACRPFAPSGTSCGADECDATAVMTLECDGSGTCDQVPQGNCTPYGCDSAAGACFSTCVTDDDCATGAVCNTQSSECAIATATCADTYTLEEPDGTQTSCAPYECEAGACQSSCDADGDCLDGYECVSNACVEVTYPGTGGSAGVGTGATGGDDTGGTSGAGTGATSGTGTGAVAGTGGSGTAGAGAQASVSEADAAGDEGGCGCRAAGGGRGGWGLWLLAGLVGLVAARRRRGPAARSS